MAVEGPIWERYERAVRGLPVDNTADFGWMLEDPDEFELRVLLRHFEQREELLERIGRYEHDPSPQYSDAEVDDLAMSLAAAYTRAASYAPEHFRWATASRPLEFRHVPADAAEPARSDTEGLFECVADAARSEIFTVTGGPALKRVLQGRVHSIGLYYLLGPFISTESDFAAALALEKSGRGYWMEGGVLIIRDPVEDPWSHLDQAGTGWDPQLDWPTDAEIAQHHEDIPQAR